MNFAEFTTYDLIAMVDDYFRGEIWAVDTVTCALIVTELKLRHK